MIKSLLLQQEEVWQDFMNNAWPEHWENGQFKSPPSKESDLEGWRMIARPQRQFEKYKRRIAQLDEDADRVGQSISTRLELKSKHAGMQKAHATAVMSAAVFGFTIITIVFTPLSFMLSLFALPLELLQGYQINSRWPDTGAYSTAYVGKWFGKTMWARENMV